MPTSQSWKFLLRPTTTTTMFTYLKHKHLLGFTHFVYFFEGTSCASKEKTSVMAREAVCSSTNGANDMRPLYANTAGRILIGREQLCVNHPGAGAVQRGRGGGGKGGTSVRVPFPQSLLRFTRSTCQNL